MMGSDWSAFGMGFGGIPMVLIWALLFFALVELVRHLRAAPRPVRAKSDDAVRILVERHARGEIVSYAP